MSSSITTQTILNRRNSPHFILISLLFLPISFVASAAVKFYQTSRPSLSTPGVDINTVFDPFNLFLIKTLLAFSSSNHLLTVKTLITVLAFICFVILPAIAGIALITYSTNQVIHHQPLTFSNTLRSLKHSYIPLLHTITTGLIILIILFLTFTLAPIAVTQAVKSLGLDSDHLFFFSIFINTFLSFALVATIVFFLVIWGSASAITILESKSGVESLRQSASQSTEFRRHSYSIVLFTGFVAGSALACSTAAQNFGLTASWILVVQTGAICLLSSLMILMYVVANTVLYVQSKVEEICGDEEIAKTTVEGEASGEYVPFVVNDKDNEFVHVPAEKEANYGGFNRLLTMFLIIFITCGLEIILISQYVREN